MSIINSSANIVNTAFSRKKIKELKAKKAEIEKLNNQLVENNDEKQKNSHLISDINKLLLLCKVLRATIILGVFTALLVFSAYILLIKKPKIIFEIHINFLIYSAVLWFSTLEAIIIMFWLDKIINKTLELGKLNFFNYVYPLLVISNILAISMPYSISKPYIVSIFYILLTISFFVNFIQNEKIFKKDKVYNFSIDFTVCNLCFIDLAIFSMINSSLLKESIYSLPLKILYIISVISYVVVFVWEAKADSKKEKNIGQYFAYTASILLLIFYVSCAVLIFTCDIDIGVIANIGSIISIFSSLFRGLKKTPPKDETDN